MQPTSTDHSRKNKQTNQTNIFNVICKPVYATVHDMHVVLSEKMNESKLGTLGLAY